MKALRCATMGQKARACGAERPSLHGLRRLTNRGGHSAASATSSQTHARGERRRHASVLCLAMAEAEKTVNFAKYAPVGDRYLVTRYEREAKTDKGVLLSATAAENQSAGEKLIVGVVRTTPEDSDLKVTKGSKILFAKYGATETTIEDASVYFVRASEVLAVLE